MVQNVREEEINRTFGRKVNKKIRFVMVCGLIPKEVYGKVWLKTCSVTALIVV